MHRDAPKPENARKDSRARWNRLRRFAPTTFLVASLAANVVLARGWIGDERKAHVARLDPAELGRYADERGTPPPAGPPVLVLFGDSRAAMWPTPPALTGYTVINRGIGYQTTAQIALRVEADVAPLHPAIVVLEAGVNDLKTLADVPERRAQIVAECEANLRSIVEHCRALGSTVVLVSIFDIGDVPFWRKPFWSDDVAAAVREVNAFLPTLVNDRVVLLDAGRVLDDDRGKVKGAYQFDYLHLLSAGYDALDERLVPLVRALPSAAGPAARRTLLPPATP